MNWANLSDQTLSACMNTFGESVTYRVGSVTTPITGIFSNVYNSVDPGTGVSVPTHRPNLGIKLSSLASKPAKTDQVTIRGVTYRVIDSQEDGEGGALLVLQKI